jgi:hypothetical protein
MHARSATWNEIENDPAGQFRIRWLQLDVNVKQEGICLYRTLKWLGVKLALCR